MLSFGIFASGTPFFVMAGLYLFYMLVNFGVKFNQQGVEDASAEECCKIESQSLMDVDFLSEASVLVLAADDFQQVISDVSALQTDNQFRYYSDTKTLNFHYGHHYVHTNHVCCLYSRPPPAI